MNLVELQQLNFLKELCLCRNKCLFPCSQYNDEYSQIIYDLSGAIENIINENCINGERLFLVGDFNSKFSDIENNVYVRPLRDCINDSNLIRLRVNQCNLNNFNHRNIELNHFSRIDHIFYDKYSNTQCVNCNILADGTNMSDHCAVLGEVKLNYIGRNNINNGNIVNTGSYKYNWSREKHC